MTRLPLILATLAAALFAIAPAAASLKGWRDGPVRYLLTAEEYREYGRLPDDAARTAFIETFWKGVAANGKGEFRKAFEKRCADADERFASPSKPGWKTDRGRVYILLGEPRQVKRETGGLRAVETEVWIYDEGGAGRAPERFAFYRCQDGEYRLDGDCHEYAKPFTTPGVTTATALQRALERNPGLATARARTFVQAILAPFPESPFAGLSDDDAHARSAAGSAGAPEGDEADSHALVPNSYFFRAEDGTVLAILCVQLLDDETAAAPAAGRSGYAAAASIAPVAPGEAGGGGTTVPLRFAPGAAGGGPASFTGTVYLEPGRAYRVRYAVKDAGRGAVFLRRGRLTAPASGSGLTVSSIVPAERFGPAADAAAGAVRIGSEEVVPKPGASFARSEPLRLYLQVYGAASDPRTGAADLDVDFRFYRVRGRREKRVRTPYSIRRAQRASMGLTLPVADWPDGEYRVAVDLHDRISGERARAEGRFRIAGP